MKLTRGLLMAMGTLPYGIALNSSQLRILGIGWPPKRGWTHGLIGKEISQEDCDLIMALRGSNKSRQKSILKQHGTSSADLFQTPIRELRHRHYNSVPTLNRQLRIKSAYPAVQEGSFVSVGSRLIYNP